MNFTDTNNETFASYDTGLGDPTGDLGIFDKNGDGVADDAGAFFDATQPNPWLGRQ